MEHRRLGRAGLKVSTLSFGSWVTFDQQLDDDNALECLQTAWDAGVTFFDNAEAYAAGESERIMGRCFARLGWPRETYTVSTKFFWGLRDGPNTRFTLNRKYLMQGIERSLERLGLQHVDLVFCHRADPETPMEEVVWSMHDMISSGRAHYWGTSEWTADQIREADALAQRHHLHRPVVEQPQYNLLHRERVEEEYAPLIDELGIGLTTWSPLASGMLTGKYATEIPEGSRGALPGYEWLTKTLTNTKALTKVKRLQTIATDLDCSLAQLSIAWCARNPNISTVITGASKVSQLHENLDALDVVDALDEQIIERVEAAVA